MLDDDDDEPETPEERIKIYRTRLIEIALEFYGKKLSDKTVIGTNHTWESLKEQVTKSDYKKEEWYKELSDYEKDLLERLKSA